MIHILKHSKTSSRDAFSYLNFETLKRHFFINFREVTYLQYLTNHANTLTTLSVLAYSGQYSDQVLMTMPICKSVSDIDTLIGLTYVLTKLSVLTCSNTLTYSAEKLKMTSLNWYHQIIYMSERLGFLYFFSLLILQYILKVLMKQNLVLMPRFVSLNTFNIYCKITSKLRDKVHYSDTALL